MDTGPWKEFKERKKKLRKIEEKIIRQKFLSTPSEFSELLQKRNKTIQVTKGKAISIKLEMIRQIWSFDEELEKMIHRYAEGREHGFNNLPEDMAEWKPYLGNAYDLYKKEKKNPYDIYGIPKSKEVSDEFINKLLNGDTKVEKSKPIQIKQEGYF